MGTAGPLALARDILDDGSNDPFFVLNRYPLVSCAPSSPVAIVASFFLMHSSTCLWLLDV